MTAGEARRRAATVARVARSPAAVWTLVRMAAWASTLPVLKRVVSLPRLVSFMSPRRSTANRSPAAERRVEALAGALYRSGAVAGRDNCLERSLLTYRYLALLNARPELVVGMGKERGELGGHVWVVVDGAPVHDSPATLEAFVPMIVFGADGRTLSP